MAEKSVIIMIIYLPFNDYVFYGGNRKIQCYIFSTITVFKYTRYIEKLCPTTTLASLVNNNSPVTNIYMNCIVGNKYQLHLLHLEVYYIQMSKNNIF